MHFILQLSVHEFARAAEYNTIGSACDRAKERMRERNEAIYHFAFCFTCFCCVAVFVLFTFFPVHCILHSAMLHYFSLSLLLRVSHTRTTEYISDRSFISFCFSFSTTSQFFPFLFIFVSCPCGGFVCIAEKCNFIYELKTFIFLADSFFFFWFAFFSCSFFALSSFPAISIVLRLFLMLMRTAVEWHLFRISSSL